MNETISLLSSSAIPTSRGDRLLVRLSTCFAGPLEVLVQIQFENRDGSVNYSHEVVTVPAGLREVEAKLPMTDGRLLRVAAWMPGFLQPAGYVYVQLALLFGSTTNNANILYLNNGYITAGNAVQYPSDPSPGSLQIDMMPLIDSDQETPGATGWSFTPLGADFGEFTYFRTTFVADANVANRTIRLRMSNADGEVMEVLGRTAITANQERLIIGWRGPNIPTDGATIHYIQLPELIWLSQPSMSVVATNFQAGDAFSAVRVGYRINKQPAF